MRNAHDKWLHQAVTLSFEEFTANQLANIAEKRVEKLSEFPNLLSDDYVAAKKICDAAEKAAVTVLIGRTRISSRTNLN